MLICVIKKWPLDWQVELCPEHEKTPSVRIEAYKHQKPPDIRKPSKRTYAYVLTVCKPRHSVPCTRYCGTVLGGDSAFFSTAQVNLLDNERLFYGL